MVIIYVERFKEINDGTLGEMFVEVNMDTVFHCYVLEPRGPDCYERGLDRRVPKGYYNVDWHSSPRFKKNLPRIYNKEVPKERYILIHAGNYPGDTEGCLLVGLNYNNTGVFNSRSALDTLTSILRQHDKIELHISNERLK